MAEYDYDMVVIGSGPAGQRAAVQAAKLGKRTAIVERHAEIGGVMVNTGTIPSKTLREAVMYLTGYRERGIYGESYSVKDDITMSDLMIRTNHVMQQKTDTLRHQLLRNRVELITADASFIDSHTIDLATVDGRSHRPVTADKVVVAVGTSAARPEETHVDGKRILLSDDVLSLPELPRSLAIIGAGVIGLEYGSIFATLGIRVTLIDRYPKLLDFVDGELVDTLVYHLRQKRVTLRLNEEVTWVEPFEDDRGEHVRIRLVSGKQIVSDAALYSIGRTGATESLGLDTVGLETDTKGRLTVNEAYQTDRTQHICGWRCDRLSEPRIHLWRTGAPRVVPRLRPTCQERSRTVPIWDLHHSGNLDGGQNRGGDDRGRRSLRGGQGTVSRDSAGADYRRRLRAAQAAVPHQNARAPGSPHHRRRSQRARTHRAGGTGI